MKASTTTLFGLALLGTTLLSCEQSIQDQLTAKRKELATIKKEISTLEELDTTKVEINQIPVTTTLVDTSTFSSFFNVHGVINTNENITIIPEFTGQIISVKVKEGQEVRKGQLIAVLDTKILRSNLRELQTAYELAVELFKKQESLRKQDIGTEIQYLEAKNRKEGLEQQISSLKTQIAKASIKAPISGKIDVLYLNTGEMASPAKPLARLVNLSNVYIETEISEAYLGEISLGEKVQVKFPSLDDEFQDAKVTYVGNFINANNRTFKLHVRLPKASKNYLPNLLSIVRIKEKHLTGQIVIPTNVIRDNGKSFFVYVVDKNSQSKMVKVVPGAEFNNKTVIESGLTAGQQLIVKGHSIVSDGSLVTVKN